MFWFPLIFTYIWNPISMIDFPPIIQLYVITYPNQLYDRCVDILFTITRSDLTSAR